MFWFSRRGKIERDKLKGRMNMMDIYLKQAIEHVIDRNFGDPIYSQVGLDLNNINIREYLSKKIQKFLRRKRRLGR
jgi:hypothetical protein